MRAPFSGSLLSLPSSVTVAPFATLWSGTAAVGGRFFTVTVTVSSCVSAAASVAVNPNVSVPCVSGAVKVGAAVEAPARETVAPPVCLQA